MSIRKTRKQRNRLRLENLEGRSLMAVTPVYVAAGWLHVLGNNATNDQAVVIDTNPVLPNSPVIVTLNGVQYGFNEAQITQGILFLGHDGNDSFATTLNRRVDAWGGDGNDTLGGSGLNDSLRGEDGADELNGGGGNDSIRGGNHNDTIDAGDGHDWVTGQTGADSIDGGSGNDTLYGYTGNDTVDGGIGNDTVSGWDGNDDLFGGDGNDKIWAHSGEDYVNGQDGQDWMDAGDDDDTMHGGDHNDTMQGGQGDDYMTGGNGDDSMLGGTWDDEMHGGDGNDWMTGQSGHDKLYGDDDDDTMYGYTGNDLLIGGDDDDYLSGWDGNDLLYGRNGDDEIYGHSGRDGIMGGNGDDTVSGGSDSDRYLVIGDEDEIASMSGGDASIGFGGPKAWTYEEIEMVDGGLAKLHHRTGNTVMLSDPEVEYDPGQPKSPRMTFLRNDVDDDLPGNVGRNHGNGLITLYDSLFDPERYHPAGLAGRVAQYSIHEIGHFWHSPTANEYELSGENVVEHFRADSGWRHDLGDGESGDETEFNGQTYIHADTSDDDNDGDNDWWYLESADFVTDYARTSPGEDFADTLAVVMMGSNFYRNSNDTVDAPTAKLAWLNAWLNNV